MTTDVFLTYLSVRSGHLVRSFRPAQVDSVGLLRSGWRARQHRPAEAALGFFERTQHKFFSAASFVCDVVLLGLTAAHSHYQQKKTLCYNREIKELKNRKAFSLASLALFTFQSLLFLCSTEAKRHLHYVYFCVWQQPLNKWYRAKMWS